MTNTTQANGYTIMTDKQFSAAIKGNVKHLSSLQQQCIKCLYVLGTDGNMNNSFMLRDSLAGKQRTEFCTYIAHVVYGVKAEKDIPCRKDDDGNPIEGKWSATGLKGKNFLNNLPKDGKFWLHTPVKGNSKPMNLDKAAVNLGKAIAKQAKQVDVYLSAVKAAFTEEYEAIAKQNTEREQLAAELAADKLIEQERKLQKQFDKKLEKELEKQRKELEALHAAKVNDDNVAIAQGIKLPRNSTDNAMSEAFHKAAS